MRFRMSKIGIVFAFLFCGKKFVRLRSNQISLLNGNRQHDRIQPNIILGIHKYVQYNSFAYVSVVSVILLNVFHYSFIFSKFLFSN